MNSFRFCLSWKLFISLSDSLASRVFLVQVLLWIFSVITLNISYHCLRAYTVSAEKSVYNLKGAPLHRTSCYFIAVSKILSLTLVLLGFILLVTPWGSWIWVSVSSPKLVTLSHYPLRHNCSPLSSLFSFWNSYTANTFLFDVSHRSLTLSSRFNFFFLFDALFRWVSALSFRSPTLSSAPQQSVQRNRGKH